MNLYKIICYENKLDPFMDTINIFFKYTVGYALK